MLIVGYQAEGTLGREIQEGAKSVKIFDEDVEVKARVEKIPSFSAHGDREKLTRWLKPESGVLPKKIFLNHGDTDQKIAFRKHLEQELEGVEIIIPELGDKFEL